MSPMRRPDPDRIRAELKDFQRATVDYVISRLYDPATPTRRFLVADEVGLGKTLVARGIVAEVIDRLWDTTKRIDIVYICSNQQIARQNLRRLNVLDLPATDLPDRITLLPRALKQLGRQKVNLVAFTPGTSFNLGYRVGRYDERAVLFRMLRTRSVAASSAAPPPTPSCRVALGKAFPTRLPPPPVSTWTPGFAAPSPGGSRMMPI